LPLLILNEEMLAVLKLTEDFINNSVIDLVSKPRFGPRQPEWDINDYDYISEYSTSDQYLKAIFSGEVEPRYYSVVHPFGEEPYGRYLFDRIPYEYDEYFTALYNPKGFVGWHTDTHITGWFIMFTYSKEGNGFFKNANPGTQEIVKYQDPGGWTWKNYYAGNTKETEFWHCAYSQSPRFSWLTKFNSEEKYNKACSAISKR